ncbi:MAG: hypothetical protein JKY02_02165 [Flavobacteriaceae bacterium]|nr:hypothetical protein [Flavobacteriaceae bacterium]
MEKSIENIWKKGFTNSDLLSIPIIENIRSLKSIYTIDKFKKMYKLNIIGLTLTAVIILLAFIFGGIPFIGMYMFTLFISMAIIGLKSLNNLNQINFGESNYEFLKAFDNWLNNSNSKILLVYKIWIPLFFIGFAFALLYTNFFIPFIGETLIDKILNNENMFIVNKIPVFWFLGIIIIAIVLSYFSSSFYKIEMKDIYGNILGEIKQLIAEVEELRS